MDNASDYESEDCRFESCQGRLFFSFFLPRFTLHVYYTFTGFLCTARTLPLLREQSATTSANDIASSANVIASSTFLWLLAVYVVDRCSPTFSLIRPSYMWGTITIQRYAESLSIIWQPHYLTFFSSLTISLLYQKIWFTIHHKRFWLITAWSQGIELILLSNSL